MKIIYLRSSSPREPVELIITYEVVSGHYLFKESAQVLIVRVLLEAHVPSVVYVLHKLILKERN